VKNQEENKIRETSHTAQTVQQTDMGEDTAGTSDSTEDQVSTC